MHNKSPAAAQEDVKALFLSRLPSKGQFGRISERGNELTGLLIPDIGDFELGDNAGLHRRRHQMAAESPGKARWLSSGRSRRMRALKAIK